MDLRLEEAAGGAGGDPKGSQEGRKGLQGGDVALGERGAGRGRMRPQ